MSRSGCCGGGADSPRAVGRSGGPTDAGCRRIVRQAPSAIGRPPRRRAFFRGAKREAGADEPRRPLRATVTADQARRRRGGVPRIRRKAIIRPLSARADQLRTCRLWGTHVEKACRGSRGRDHSLRRRHRTGRQGRHCQRVQSDGRGWPELDYLLWIRGERQLRAEQDHRRSAGGNDDLELHASDRFDAAGVARHRRHDAADHPGRAAPGRGHLQSEHHACQRGLDATARNLGDAVGLPEGCGGERGHGSSAENSWQGL